MAKDFDYGNARVRAMKARLFDAHDYQELLAKDLDGLIASLAQTGYKPDVEAALVRYGGLALLHEALRMNLARTLRQVASFYEGPPRQQIDLLLARWDRRNLLTLVRAQAASAPLRRTEDVLTLLVPAGALDAADLAELARQPELRAMIDLMVSWKIPDAETGRILAASWTAYERSDDLSVLETSINRAYVQWLDRHVQCSGTDGVAPAHRPERNHDVLASVLCAEIEQLNLLIALRLREAHLIGGPLRMDQVSDRFLPAGNLKPRVLVDAVTAKERQDVIALLAAMPGISSWRGPLEAWQESGDLAALERDLEDELTRQAAGLFVKGDPLGIAVPLAFTYAKENEIRNLRILGQGLAHQVEPAEIRELLLVL